MTTTGVILRIGLVMAMVRMATICGEDAVAMATTAIAIAISTPVRMKWIARELGVMAPDFSYLRKVKPS